MRGTDRPYLVAASHNEESGPTRPADGHSLPAKLTWAGLSKLRLALAFSLALLTSAVAVARPPGPPSIFDPTRLYLTEEEYALLDRALQEEFRSDPSPNAFNKIIDGMLLHGEALRRGRIRASFAIRILEGAASRFFVHLGENVPGPWPARLVAPLLKDFLTSERSAYRSWGAEANMIEGNGALRILVPDAPAEWRSVTRSMEAELAYPVLLVTSRQAPQDPPTHRRPVLNIRVYRYHDSYYEVRFDFEDGYEGFGYGAICRFQNGLLEVFVMDWDL